MEPRIICADCGVPVATLRIFQVIWGAGRGEDRVIFKL